MRCRECGGDVILFHTHEYICTRCGLVNGYETTSSYKDISRTAFVFERSPVKLGTRPPKKYGIWYTPHEKRLSYVIEYIKYYANGNKAVLERAIYLARKHLKDLDKKRSLEAFAIACVEAANREINRTSILMDVDKNHRKKAKKYLREVLGNPHLDVREAIVRKIVGICSQLGLNYNKCIATFSKVELYLTGKTPRVAAAVVVYLTYPQISANRIANTAGVLQRTIKRVSSKLPEHVINEL